MINREKVIKGLTCHVHGNPQTRCHKCPYWGTGPHGLSQCNLLFADALALLNPQKPRVMQFSEIMMIYNADPFHVWPYNTPPYLYIQEHPHVRNSSEAWAAWREIRDIIEGELFGHTAQSYGKTWRCWTSKPTREQREVEPWQ